MIHQPVNCLIHGLFFNSKPLIESWERVGATVLSIAIVYAICRLSLTYFENPIRRIGAKHHYAKPKEQPESKPLEAGIS